MPRSPDPTVRDALIERAAEMLARREPVTLRSLVSGVGVSTIAVYTYFDSMAGLWRAVRQEGFSRLAQRLAGARPSRDPVQDLVALGAAYTAHALANPNLYRAMFDAGFDLDDPGSAAQSFGLLVEVAARAREQGRFGDQVEPEALATQFWMIGHGVLMLVLTGVMPPSALAEHVPPMMTALFLAAGDHPESCRRSVTSGWGDPVGEVAVGRV